jgi:hypothetical protein
MIKIIYGMLPSIMVRDNMLTIYKPYFDKNVNNINHNSIYF